MEKIYPKQWAQLMVCRNHLFYALDWLASRYVNCNSSYANFGLRNVNNANLNGNNLFNSDGNTNNNNNYLRPVASIHCGYAITDCIRDNIETNCCPVIRIISNYK